jgi:hypothetical protein
MKNKKYIKIFFIVIAFLVIGSYIFNADSFNYKRDFDKKYEFELKTADSGDWDSPITRLVGPNPYYVFIGDANNDGYNDIATANIAGSSVSILLWNITSSDWDSQITRSVGSGPMGIFIGDANNDGYNDIVTSNSGEFPECTISILLWNTTLGDWDPQIVRLVGGSSTHNIFIGDTNNDGYNDITTSNPGSNTVSILLWNITSSDWDSQITRSVGSGPVGIFIGDANNDGYNDIVTSNVGTETISILLWNTTSSDWDPQISRNARYNPTGVFIGDANNDGYNDIVTSNEEAGDVSILLWNITSGDWDPQINRHAGNGPYSLFIGDANYDGYNDIITADWFSDTVSILLWNTISGNWNPKITRSVGDNPHGVFLGDANNDGYNDIVAASMDPNTVSILLWNVPPEIVINSPDQDGFIGTVAPEFDLSINESSLDTTWYTLDGGSTNYTFVGTLGTINQTVWDALSGPITIEFYANDSVGNIGYASVAVNKDIDAPTSSMHFVPYSGTDKVIKSTNFTITADDGDGSGVFVIQYNINNTGWIDYSGPFDLSSFEYGNFVISYRAIDDIGNIEEINIVLGSLVEETAKTSIPEVPGYNVLLLIGIICLVSIFLIKKRHKYKIN